MKIQAIHTNFMMPTHGTEHAAGYDIYMPDLGILQPGQSLKIPLGFAAEIPVGFGALLMPRSGWGSKGIALMNTVGLIDADYRGEWVAHLKNTSNDTITWEPGDKLVQFIVVPIINFVLMQVDSVAPTERGDGGFGSTGK